VEKGAEAIRWANLGFGDGTEPSGEIGLSFSSVGGPGCKLSGSTSRSLGFLPDTAPTWAERLRCAIGEGGRVVKEEMEVSEFPIDMILGRASRSIEAVLNLGLRQAGEATRNRDYTQRMRSGKYEAKRHIGRIQVDPGSRSDNAYCQRSFHKTASDGELRRGRQRIS
jgi:hypothetical protein